METRASYILVGSFVLGLVAAVVGVAIWLAGVEFDKAPVKYVTYFSGDVTGLGIGSAVRYRGVPVGSVRDIRLDPANVERVQVLMDISVDAPVKEDTVAELALQGITGVAFIQLSGGTQAAPALKAAAGAIPVIKSKPSLLQEVVTKLPQVIERAVLIADRLGGLFSDKNMNAISATLANMENFTRSLGSDKGGLQLLLRDGRDAANALRAAAADVRQTARTIGTFTGNLDKRLEPMVKNTENSLVDFRSSMADLSKAAATIHGIAESAQGLLEDNRGPIRDFSQTGLYEFTLFIAEARVLVDSLTRLANRIERDPTNFLFGDSQKGVRAQ